MARSCLTIILAAGEGTRMRSSTPKVLHPVAGLPMLGHVVAAAAGAGVDAISVVVGSGAQTVAETALGLDERLSVHEQTERLGTAHAVLAAEQAIARGYDDLLILFADTPLTRPDTLLRMRGALAEGAGVAVLGFRTETPTGYGRLILDGGGRLLAIREERDASQAERAITLCNGGIMALDGARALELLRRIGNDNAKGEYYLTDIVAVCNAEGIGVVPLEADEEEVLGVNNRAELARAEALWQQRRRHELMLAGVSMEAPETVHLSYDTVVGADTLVEPHVYLGTGVAIGEGVHLRAFSHLERCEIADGAAIGPFARIRPGTRMAQGSKVGNFCELKNADIGPGAKVNHLAYVGDATVGERANIGAGAITCNYDGVAKHHTNIGAGAFIGSNASLVAPVAVGAGAYVGSGSVITRDVPDEALAVARGRQTNKEGFATVIRRRSEAMKNKR